MNKQEKLRNTKLNWWNRLLLWLMSPQTVKRRKYKDRKSTPLDRTGGEPLHKALLAALNNLDTRKGDQINCLLPDREGELIKALLIRERLKSGLSQGQVAKKIGCSDTTMSNFESGKTPIASSQVRTLSRALKVYGFSLAVIKTGHLKNPKQD